MYFPNVEAEKMRRKDFIRHRKRTYGRESHRSVEIVVTFKKNVTSASNICLSQSFSCFCICMFKSEVLKSKVKNPRKIGQYARKSKFYEQIQIPHTENPPYTNFLEIFSETHISIPILLFSTYIIELFFFK